MWRRKEVGGDARGWEYRKGGWWPNSGMPGVNDWLTGKDRHEGGRPKKSRMTNALRR